MMRTENYATECEDPVAAYLHAKFCKVEYSPHSISWCPAPTKRWYVMEGEILTLQAGIPAHEETVVLRGRRWQELERAERFLNLLEAYGVDGWEGWGHVVQVMGE